MVLARKYSEICFLSFLVLCLILFVDLVFALGPQSQINKRSLQRYLQRGRSSYTPPSFDQTSDGLTKKLNSINTHHLTSSERKGIVTIAQVGDMSHNWDNLSELENDFSELALSKSEDNFSELALSELENDFSKVALSESEDNFSELALSKSEDNFSELALSELENDFLKVALSKSEDNFPELALSESENDFSRSKAARQQQTAKPKTKRQQRMSQFLNSTSTHRAKQAVTLDDLSESEDDFCMVALENLPELRLSLQKQKPFLKQLSLKDPTKSDVQNSTFFASLRLSGFESSVSQETREVWYYHVALKKALKDKLSKNKPPQSFFCFDEIVELTALIALRNVVTQAYGFDFWNNTFIEETKKYFRQHFQDHERKWKIEDLLRSLGKKTLQSHWKSMSLDPSSEQTNVFQRMRSLKLPSADQATCSLRSIRTIRQSA